MDSGLVINNTTDIMINHMTKSLAMNHVYFMNRHTVWNNSAIRIPSSTNWQGASSINTDTQPKPC